MYIYIHIKYTCVYVCVYLESHISPYFLVHKRGTKLEFAYILPFYLSRNAIFIKTFARTMVVVERSKNSCEDSKRNVCRVVGVVVFPTIRRIFLPIEIVRFFDNL